MRITDIKSKLNQPNENYSELIMRLMREDQELMCADQYAHTAAANENTEYLMIMAIQVP